MLTHPNRWSNILRFMRATSLDIQYSYGNLDTKDWEYERRQLGLPKEDPPWASGELDPEGEASYAYITRKGELLDICLPDYFTGHSEQVAAIPLPIDDDWTPEDLAREVDEQTYETSPCLNLDVDPPHHMVSCTTEEQSVGWLIRFEDGASMLLQAESDIVGFADSCGLIDTDDIANVLRCPDDYACLAEPPEES